MNYEKELEFVKKLLGNLHLSLHFIKEPFDFPSVLPDLGLRKLLNPDFDYSEMARLFPQICHPNHIYRMKDLSLCYYLLFQIPNDDEPLFAIIGPYALTHITANVWKENTNNLSLPSEIIPQLEKYYQEIPFISDENYLLTILYTLGEKLWGSTENFTFQEIPDLSAYVWETAITRTPSKEAGEPFLSIRVLENRYSIENDLMQAVASGQSHKAEVLFHAFSSRTMEERSPDPLRNWKNYAIILNTLLRKAAEQGSVHPLHIDSISSKFAKKIEHCTSIKAVEALDKEMVHQYCLLVQNHSLKGYSILIQKVLTHIDSDLTADLSLYAQAKQLNVNSSYLSALFKKETGSTLTEYVNKKRIRHAVFLLNSTNLQIQMIAQQCGIPDVNYFIKTFKKHVGKTPKEYRDSIAHYAKHK